MGGKERKRQHAKSAKNNNPQGSGSSGSNTLSPGTRDGGPNDGAGAADDERVRARANRASATADAGDKARISANRIRTNDRAGADRARAGGKSDRAGADRAGASANKTGGGDGGALSCVMMAVVMGAVLAVYVATLHPSLPGGDAGELITAASEWGVAHPPGYPLYTVLMKAWFLVLPYGSVAWRANLLSAAMAAAAASSLYQAVLLLTGSVAGGLLAAGLFAFSRLTWAWSVTAEVFALNNLLLALLMILAVRFSHTGSSQVAQMGAFVCGLCLTNQHTTIVYIAILVPWVLHTLYSQNVLSVGLLARLTVCFALGLSPYIYLPLSSMYGQARWTWGDQTTVSGLLTHLLRQEYGTMHLLKDHEGQGFVAGLIAYLKHVGKDLTPMGLFFFISTILSLHKRWGTRQSGILIIMLLMLVTYAVFFAWRANLDIEKPLFRGVVERFWLQSDVVVLLLAGVAFSDIMSLINSLMPMLRLHVDKLLAVVLVVMQIGVNMSECDQSGSRVVEDFARTTLRAFPQDALVLTKGDLPSNSLRYYHLVEGVRPDITLFDQEVLTYEWSVPKLGPHAQGVEWPGDRLHLTSGVNSQGVRKFTFLQLLDAHYHRRPIFACIGVQDHEPSWQAGYELRPFGVCMQFVKKGAGARDLSDWLTASRSFALNWSLPVFDSESTWEEIASAEMWRAKTAAGLYLLEKSESVQKAKNKASLLRHAYKIYKEAMEAHRHFPSYWHKNFALVCEKLRHVAEPSETVPLIRTTITHFRAYLESGTQDPQGPVIRDAIARLQGYLNMATQREQQHTRS